MLVFYKGGIGLSLELRISMVISAEQLFLGMGFREHLYWLIVARGRQTWRRSPERSPRSWRPPSPSSRCGSQSLPPRRPAHAAPSVWTLCCGGGGITGAASTPMPQVEYDYVRMGKYGHDYTCKFGSVCYYESPRSGWNSCFF